MWFKELKEKFLESTAQKLSSSNFTLSSIDDLKWFIEKSANTSFKNSKTGEEKTFIKRCIVIFGEEKTDFFKKALYRLPILWTKSFSQNIQIKLAKSNIKDLKPEEYKIKTFPSMIVFENKKIHKVIEWEENILKIVKETHLDINKSIDEM